jgi:hypothetical protein
MSTTLPETMSADPSVYVDPRDSAVILYLEREVERLQAALKQLVYEVTHLSPEEDDGSHWCKISRKALADARKALGK